MDVPVNIITTVTYGDRLVITPLVYSAAKAVARRCRGQRHKACRFVAQSHFPKVLNGQLGLGIAVTILAGVLDSAAIAVRAGIKNCTMMNGS
jgi:hypothetical protein